MNFVLVLLPILALLSGGWSITEVTEQNSDLCYRKCPAGYHKTGLCNDSAGMITCEKCATGTFTNIENYAEKCRRCSSCHHNEWQKNACSHDRDVECDCIDGYYYKNKETSLCISCSGRKNHPVSDHDDYQKKCCQRKAHMNVSRCKTQSTTPSSTTPQLSLNTTVATPTPTTENTSSSKTSNPDVKTLPENIWIPRLVAVVIVVFGVLFCFLLWCTRNRPGKANSYPCWSTKKHMKPHAEDPIFNEQRSHQGSTPTTLTFNISEETPMMPLSQCPASAQDQAHVSPLPPNAEHGAARQDEQPEHWPAVVLYAIIKEVPLRRWKEFLRLLSVADQQLERVELEAGLGLGSMERQYQMLRLWSQRSTANLNDVFSALHYMDLSGCAQLLQESLEKLQWRQDITACRSNTT